MDSAASFKDISIRSNAYRFAYVQNHARPGLDCYYYYFDQPPILVKTHYTKLEVSPEKSSEIYDSSPRIMGRRPPVHLNPETTDPRQRYVTASDELDRTIQVFDKEHLSFLTHLNCYDTNQRRSINRQHLLSSHRGVNTLRQGRSPGVRSVGDVREHGGRYNVIEAPIKTQYRPFLTPRPQRYQPVRYNKYQLSNKSESVAVLPRHYSQPPRGHFVVSGRPTALADHPDRVGRFVEETSFSPPTFSDASAILLNSKLPTSPINKVEARENFFKVR